MAIAFILMFAPVLYNMHFVAGFTAPADAYMACAAAACAASVWEGGLRNLSRIFLSWGSQEPAYLAGNWAVPVCRLRVAVQAPRILTTAVPGDRCSGYRCGHVHFLQSQLLLTVIILVGSAMLQVVPGTGA